MAIYEITSYSYLKIPIFKNNKVTLNFYLKIKFKNNLVSYQNHAIVMDNNYDWYDLEIAKLKIMQKVAQCYNYNISPEDMEFVSQEEFAKAREELEITYEK